MIIFHDFSWLSMTFAIFHDFPGLENGLPKFHDFRWLSMIRRHPGVRQPEQDALYIMDFAQHNTRDR